MIKTKEIRFVEGGNGQFGGSGSVLAAQASVSLPYGCILIDILIYYVAAWQDSGTVTLYLADENNTGGYTLPYSDLKNVSPQGLVYGIREANGGFISQPPVNFPHVETERYKLVGAAVPDFAVTAGVQVQTGGSFGGDTRIVIMYDEPDSPIILAVG